MPYRKRLMAQNVMTRDFNTFSPTTSIRQALTFFLERRFDVAPVVDEKDALVGVITKSACCKALLRGLSIDDTICEVYSRVVYKVNQYERLDRVCEKLHDWSCANCIVVDDFGSVVGIIRKSDLHILSTSELRKEMDKATNILNNIPFGIVVIDDQGCITYSNACSQLLLGIPEDHLLKKRISEIVPEAKAFIKSKGGFGETDVRHAVNHGSLRVAYQPIMQAGEAKGQLLIFAEQQYEYAQGMESVTASSEREIITVSDNMREIMQQAMRVAPSLSTILILGESGTGKEVLARQIHAASGRSGKFVKVNCAAIPDNLLESELFGYEGGAFTGALRGGKKGKFEIADGGTIFLDEIGDMSLPLQAKILGVLQDREFERVGGHTPIKVDIRVIAATNQDLEQLVAEGKFRKDLYYRLNVVSFTLPPLRERRDDIVPLARFFVVKFSRKLGGKVKDISPEAQAILRKYDWPGNVRELENVIERAINLTSHSVIGAQDLPENLREYVLAAAVSYRDDLKRTERSIIEEALKITKGNKRRAAELLGISRSTLYEKLNTVGSQ